MATTTNYSWTTPDDTALVKDGAAAIRSLGTSIDTTTKNLNPSTTLGDIEYRSSTANVNTRLAIGSTGNILTVAGGVPTWAAPAGGGGMTSITSGSLTGSSISLTSITGYNDLQLVLRDQFNSTASTGFGIRFNSFNTNEYNQIVQATGGQSTVSAASSFSPTDAANYADNTDGDNALIFNIFDYANTTAKKLINYTYVFKDAGGTTRLVQGFGYLNSTNAISTVKIETTSGNFGGGTYILYGVK